MMTEAQAWREIARRIAEGEWYHIGLCAEIDNIAPCNCGIPGCILGAENPLVSVQISRRMRSRLSNHLEGAPWFDDRGVADTRVLAALFLALEAEDEAAA
jgi:hypothetical protein